VAKEFKIKIQNRPSPAGPLYAYQKTKQYFAQIPGGVEAIAMEELARLGAEKITPGFRGAYFSADRPVLYRINYQARLITRVLAPLISFPCRDRDDLYRVGNAIDWMRFFSVDQTFGIFSNVSGNQNITHTNFASLCLKDAIVDQFRGKCGRRPDVDKAEPDFWLNLHIEKTHGVISIDTSGGSLHRRGYRIETVAAPMQEILAAAIVELSGWQGEKPIYDPMCGSGTLVCEAMMRACRIPSGYLKKNFGFFFLPDFDRNLWERVKQAADEGIRSMPPGLAAGSDIDRIAVKAARKNCDMLPGGKDIAITLNDFREIQNLENRVILCNPPYGIRLQQEEGLETFYKELGDFLKQRCNGSSAYVFFGNRELLKSIGLKSSWKIPMKNAGLDGRIARFDMY
jgi:putative N6-adenine-specific DNA methylase